MAKLSEYSQSMQMRLITSVNVLWDKGHDPFYISDELNIPINVVLYCRRLKFEDDLIGEYDND